MKANQPIDITKPVLVTGGSGYIASWIVKTLLDKGFAVRTTVRNKTDIDKYKHFLKIAEASKGSLEVFEADLLTTGSFAEAMKGCELIFHTASPFKTAGIKNPRTDLLDPALEGTRNVLLSASATPSVKRIVLTASAASIYGDAIEIKHAKDGVFTEEDWNKTSSLKHQPYSYSKTVAEQEAWKIAGEQEQWDLVTIHPGFVLGPSITKRIDSTSIDFMVSILNGKYKTGIPDLYFGIVDVRDVALIQVAAGLTPAAHGRYIAVSGSMGTLEIANILHKAYPDNIRIPQKTLSKTLFYLFGPMQGFSWKYIRNNLEIPIQFDNSRSREELGINYRAIDQTLLDHAEQLIRDELIKR
jgi:nucleoside-diphosphate-sugar epimerase